MSETSLFWLSISIVLLGLALVGALVYFGWSLFKLRLRDLLPDELDVFIRHYISTSQKFDPAILTSTIEEYLSRRNEFWTLFGQFALSILVVMVLTILLLVKAISAEAGLPILAGVGGFAIGKGAQASRGITTGRPPRQE